MCMFLNVIKMLLKCFLLIFISAIMSNPMYSIWFFNAIINGGGEIFSKDLYSTTHNPFIFQNK